MAQNNTRIWELDFIRGLCLLLMILDHTLFDLGFVFRQQWFPAGGEGWLYQICRFAGDFYWDWALRRVVHGLALACFIGICGISCSFSRSNLRRGFRLMLVALAISAVTYGMDYFMGLKDFYIIRWGILHMLATSIILYAVLQNHRSVVLLLGMILMLAGWYFSAKPLDVNGLLPTILGLKLSVYSADYFPLLPWMGYFLFGAVVGARLYREKRSFFPQRGQGRITRPILFVGRHSLFVYILHQPLVYGLLFILGYLRG